MWIRGRSNLRLGRAVDEDEFQLDLTKDHVENLKDILANVCKKQGVCSERRRLSYLNAFVKLLTNCEHDYNKLGFTAEEILYCLRPSLLHDTTQVRSGGLRALRYMLHSQQEAAICIKLQYPLLVARSLDLIVGSDNERVQAARVVRRLLCLDASQFPVSLARSLVAIASGTEDRLVNVTLGTLAELCVLNPGLFIAVGGVTTLLRSLTSVKSARMAEAIVGSLLFLQNKPDTRQKAALNLDCLAAPYTDLQSANQGVDRLRWPHATLLSTLRSWPGMLLFCHPLRNGLRSIVATLYLNQQDVRKAVLDLLFELLCLAQPEWSDEVSVALEAIDPSRPQDTFRLTDGFVAAEGRAVLPHLSKCRVNLSELHLALLLYCFLEAGLLDAIVEVIIAEDPFLSVRATVLLGELLHLTHLLLPPECCHLTPSLPNLLSYAVRGRPHSLPTQRPSYFQHEDSVANLPTNRDINPTMFGMKSGRTSVRTASESSTERAVKPETNKFNQSRDDPTTAGAEKKCAPGSKQKLRDDKMITHLLKDVREVLADMSNTPRHRKLSNSLKSSFGSSTPPLSEPPPCGRAQQRALAAVTALSQLHCILRRRPAPSSIYLDHTLAAVNKNPPLDGLALARAKGRTQNRTKLAQALAKECDDAIKESQVLTLKDSMAWNWDIIRAVLKSRPECLVRCEESTHRQFLRRLVQFVAPSSRQMSRVDLPTDRRSVNHYTLTAIDLLDCLLLGPRESECERMLRDLLIGLKTQIEAITSGKSPHDCLFSPHAVSGTLCQDYFLLLGHLSRSRLGCDLLDRLEIMHSLLVLSTTSKHDCYVKLVISSLDYSTDERTRNVMASTLVCMQIPSRLYATKFLRVLLRMPLHKHRGYGQWVVELLANQLSDKNRAVSLAAVAALDEACDCLEYLNALINLRPSLLHLGEKGLLLLVRFFSTETGFRYMSEANLVTTQLSKWVKFNLKYVCIVEGELADGMTLVERNEDGRYSTRLSHSKRVPGDVYVPPHLYGQMAQHSAGLDAVLTHENLPKLVQVVLQGQCSSDTEILELKAALWALGHLSSCPGGAVWARHTSVTRAMVDHACSCPVYAVRATAFHTIALTASNMEGADTLRALGWHSVRHNRGQHWPVVFPLSMLEDALLQYQEDTLRDSSESASDTVTKSGLFILGEDAESDENSSSISFPRNKMSMRERKSATLPPTGSSHTYHHNRSYSESKADSEWPSDISDIRSHENSRLCSDSSTSSGEASQPRNFISERLTTIPSADSLTPVKSQRKISVASLQGPSLSPKDIAGYAALRSLHRNRRPSYFPSPHLSLTSSSHSDRGSVSPLSPIELIAFQDWPQMSPLLRPKHPDIHHIEPQFEVTGVSCPIPNDPLTSRTLHYESSHSCIAQPPDDPVEENSIRPCYQGICLPQNLVDLFLVEEVGMRRYDHLQDNGSATGVDGGSSCDSETDTAGEGDVEKRRINRRHHHTSCLLCCVSRMASQKPTRWRKISASSQHRTRTETESSYGGGVNEGESPVVVLPWHSRGGLEGITSVDSTGTDITSMTQRSLGDTFKSRSTVRKEILRLAEQLCNPILYKTCKQALLQLKQMYGDVFNDICVYSDVCSIMASAQHRIYARRFLQELFLDAPFSELYEDPMGILTSPNNVENDDGIGPSGDKLVTGSEIPHSDDLVTDTTTRKIPAPKTNGFEPDQRLPQGYELEVILENDARSETSEIGRGNVETGMTRSSIVDIWEGVDSSPHNIKGLDGQSTMVENQIPHLSSTPSDRLDNIGSSLHLQESIPSTHNNSEDSNKVNSNKREALTFMDSISEPVGHLENTLSCTTLEGGVLNDGDQPFCDHDSFKSEIEHPITVSRSSQKLKQEFFSVSLSPVLSIDLEKSAHISSPINELKSFIGSPENFATKVTESISKSQQILETKQSQPSICYGNNSKDSAGNSDSTVSMKKVGRKDNSFELTKKSVSSTKLSVAKLDKCKHSDQKLVGQQSNQSKLGIKPNQMYKKSTKHNNINSSNATSKQEVQSSSHYCSSEESNSSKDVNNLGESNQAKMEYELKDIESNKGLNKMSLESHDDASTSKAQAKQCKQRSNESTLTKGKPPVGSGRQRKKPVTKTPNRDSLEGIKKDN